MLFPVKRVAVIGAGPSGLALAKALLAEQCFDTVQLFERQSQTGGVWNYNAETRPTTFIPSVDPYKTEPPVVKHGKQVYYGAMYKDLETNIPKEVMMYNKTPFGEALQTFPTRDNVLKYVQAYGEPVSSVVKLNADVTAVQKVGRVWTVTYTKDSQEYTQTFDAVVICTGHYDLPYIPEVLGIEQWAARYPNSISHSKYYNDPADFAGQTVLVIGNSASGLDVSMQIADHAKKVYRSVVAESKMPFVQDQRVTDVPIVRRYDSDSHVIELADGTRLDKVDKIVYCTGYLYSFPYLKTYMDPSHPQSLITKGDRLNAFYKQLFYAPDPTLALIVMTKFTVPFPLAETQGAVVARVFSGRLALPSSAEMLASVADEEATKGTGGSFHYLQFPADVNYIRELQAWMTKSTSPNSAADPGVKVEGFEPEVWDDIKYEKRKGATKLKQERLKYKLSKL